MVKNYLLLNAFLYAALAVWCTVKHGQTSRASGYVELNASGHSEYLVIYGGLQVGLAIAFCWAAFEASLHRPALVFSLIFYAPIVVYRVITILMYRPVSGVTMGTGALEVLLLLGAIALWVFRRPA